MKRNQYGIYYTVIEPTQITDTYEEDPVYEYKFRVNGLLTYDPENFDKLEDGSGSYYSRFVLEGKDTDRQTKTMVLEDSANEERDLRTVKFQIYLPDAEVVRVVGNFNDWNPENDFLKKDRKGVFTLEKNYYQVNTTTNSLWMGSICWILTIQLQISKWIQMNLFLRYLFLNETMP